VQNFLDALFQCQIALISILAECKAYLLDNAFLMFFPFFFFIRESCQNAEEEARIAALDRYNPFHHVEPLLNG
jgi:hypothetical protein